MDFTNYREEAAQSAVRLGLFSQYEETSYVLEVLGFGGGWLLAPHSAEEYATEHLEREALRYERLGRAARIVAITRTFRQKTHGVHRPFVAKVVEEVIAEYGA